MKILNALVPNPRSSLIAHRSSLLSLFLLPALSLSIGWGIRGNFGHENGALIPGALAAIAVVLTAGRADWGRRIAYFAFFGALGWSFGGSMSYGQVLGYTHSGHSLSVIYGFASLFVIGFLWGSVGGVGTALPAVLNREQLTEFFAPLTAIFLAWQGQDLFERWLVTIDSAYRQESPLYWYDTDWLGVVVAIVAVLVLALIRRRLDQASTFILYMAVGWWVGFAVLVLLLGVRMTPPRGDNWAGCVGMTAGMILYCERRGWRALTRAAVIAGFVGGFGFAFANLIKLLGIATGWPTNWHSVMEQSYGFINGLGIAAVMLPLARQAPAVSDEPPVRRWTEIYALCFVLVVMTYINFDRNPETWVKAGTVPAAILGISADAWFALAYLLLGVMLVTLLVRHLRQPLPFIPAGWLGKGQLFYLVLLWWVVIGNFERSVVAFAPQRLVTEGVIFFNAVVCSWLLLMDRQEATAIVPVRAEDARPQLGKTILIGFAGMVLCVIVSWVVVWAIYRDTVAGGIKRQIRFGAESTATSEKPAAGQPHP
jgi:hypothetical protein